MLFATLTPLDDVEPLEWESADKAIHLVIFMILTLLFYLAYPNMSRWRILSWMISYGLIIEILQHILPLGRSFDWYDWLFDVFGVIIGYVVCYFTLIPKKIKNMSDFLLR